ncbi:protein-tyrosine phosphatase-like protein [Lentinula guzmanii]|uniref:Protein-tyrosine phosphatase-like protein n=2 Tax=Lentinula TaxID=5352 RepID=A0AA38MYD4_9AGAR|nr:protein-tyrosine phosphatase-like protein [Lentinula guzmanii]KAJ3781712.1 protein-tyrosine phosphatase-like protein [Lentinula aff. detonsa]KAJ3798240.1 protein-tyrosine phosphatase-like protein [Lentinula aff. detonsa]
MSNYSAGIKSSTTRSDQRADQRLLAKMSPLDRPYPLNAVCPRPIPNSYWATPLLLACEYPWSPKNPYKPKLDALLKAGVRTFIDLTECGELKPYSNILCGRATLLGIDPSTIEYYNFPIRDRSLPQSVEYMNSVLDVLRDNQVRGRISAVHCRGGIGRTGMVIGCWLVQSGIAKDGDEALHIIAKEWSTVEKCKRFPHSPETGPQFEFVQRWIRRDRCGKLDLGDVSLSQAQIVM